jgi:RNase H-fold protein (predicted Holliday junction resolvase)
MAKTILGISAGTRIVGLAVIKKGELVEWRVKSYKEKWSRDKEKTILATIQKLCGYYEVQILSIKKVDPLASTPQLERLQSEIIRQAKRKKIKVVQYSLSDLDYDMRSGSKQARETLSEEIVKKHPALKEELLRERNNRREYYTKMFEAIAMAERCRDE